MALFKPFRGNRASLDAQPLHDGYAYFCVDDGTFHIDYTDSEGNLHRKQIGTGDEMDDINSAIGIHNEDPLAHADIREEISQLSSEKVDKNQGVANVGKILVVGADGNFTLTDMPEGGTTGDVVGMVDENNNIVITGNLANGTYVFKYEGADGTYADIGSLVVGGVVQYSISTKLTECTAISGNTNIINADETVTLRFVAKDGFALTDTVTVSGASHTWDSATGTLVLSNPTADIVITIIATKSGVTNIIDTVGYTDDKRLSTSSGSLTDATGYTSTGTITIPLTLARPVTVRTDGVNFNKSNSCAIVLYGSTGTKTASTQLYNKGTSAFNGFTWSFDADGNMTMIYDSSYAVYFKICGYGSGADLIVTINEEITK